MMMNFKNASHAYWSELTWMPYLTLPMSYLLTRAPFLLFKRPADYKYLFDLYRRIMVPLFMTTHMLIIYWHCHR